MEIQNVLEEYWYGLHCELWNISQLNAGDFVTRAQAVVGSGTEEQIVAMLRQSINEYQGERSIMKYIYILDKLLKIPEFCLALQESLPELYTSVFVSLLLQKCGKEM